MNTSEELTNRLASLSLKIYDRLPEVEDHVKEAINEASNTSKIKYYGEFSSILTKKLQLFDKMLRAHKVYE